MRRTLALVGILIVAAGAGVISFGRTRDQLAVVDACEAARGGDAQRALALTEGRTGPSATGRTAAECRCHALLATGDARGCVALLDPLVQEPDDWTPEPELAALLVRQRSEEGRTAEAAALARAVGHEHPEDPSFFRVELEARAAVEPEESVMRDLATRIPEQGEAAALMRVSLAQRHLLRGDPPAGLRALGAELPDGAEGAISLWFDTLGIAHAMNDDLAGARESYARWQHAGGQPEEVRARYALALSVSGLVDPERNTVTALRAALRDAAAISNPRLEEAVGIRLIFSLVASGRPAEAIATYDALHERLPLDGVHREELERAREGAAFTGRAASEKGRIRFALETPAPMATGEKPYALWVSPDATAAPDESYERLAITPDEPVEIERAAALAPQRWVLRTGDGATAGSGTVYVRPGDTRSLAIRAAQPSALPAAPALARAPGDGHRRVAMVLLDCGDWAISQYLRARGDVPVLDALMRSGYRAVLDSDPPLTAAALESLVWPERRSDASLAGTFYRLGTELAGLESVGANPFELLSWVLPESRDLFTAIGAGEHTAANLLFAHGGVRAGRHGEVIGPRGASRQLEIGRARRELDPAERARFPGLADLGDGMDAHYVHTIAAEFDATEELLRGREIDFVALRVEPLDILTHSHFAEAVREGQDDGAGLLFETYRYIDGRIGALHPLLDADDVLIVLSDHGIRTAMEHDRPALFVATGGGVPSGRASGRPSLRGVARVVADLLGVATAWPETGVAAWTRAFARNAATP